MVEVEVKTDGDKIRPAALPVLLPEDILKYLIGECSIPLNDEACEAYWEHFESVGDEQALSSRTFRLLEQKPVIPLGIHGDGASMGLIGGPQEKIMGWFLNLPLYRPRATRLSRYLLFSVENNKVVDLERTIDPLLRCVVDSLNRCTETGVLGRRFLASELRGDQAWWKYLFDHKSWWKATAICYRCEATTRSGPTNYVNYNGWQGTQRSTIRFVLEELPARVSHFEVN